jgi:hypothetical protein
VARATLHHGVSRPWLSDKNQSLLWAVPFALTTSQSGIHYRPRTRVRIPYSELRAATNNVRLSLPPNTS